MASTGGTQITIGSNSFAQFTFTNTSDQITKSELRGNSGSSVSAPATSEFQSSVEIFEAGSGARNFGLRFSLNGVAQQGTATVLASSQVIARITFAPVATTAPVPETETWAMMVLGMGAVGGAMRARRRQAAALAA